MNSSFRNRLIAIGLILLAVAVAVAATTAGNLIWPEYTRTYQHLEAAGADALDSGSDGFVSHLPLVLIDTGGITIEEYVKKPVMVSVIDHESGGNRVTDTPQLTTASLINIRGATSSLFEKPSYRLNFIEDITSTKRESHPVMGLPSEIDWVLHGPYLDKSLMRNYLMYNLAGEIMEWAPNVRFCEVFIDGMYEGLYLMTEAVTVDKKRVNVSTKETAQGAIGYLLQRGVEGNTKTPIESFGTHNCITNYELGVEFPNAVDITPGNIAYILDSVNAFEEKLYASIEGDDTRAFAEEIDLNSFVDYFIINEFSMNRDAGYFSTYAYRDPRGKLTMGPVWDYNNCFDNHIDETPYAQVYTVNCNWYYALVRDPVFVDTVIWRYARLRKTILNEDRLLAMVDDIAAYLGPAIDRNFARWDQVMGDPILIENTDGTDRNSYTYAEAIDQLKTAIITKGRYLDEHMAEFLRENIAEYEDD